MGATYSIRCVEKNMNSSSRNYSNCGEEQAWLQIRETSLSPVATLSNIVESLFSLISFALYVFFYSRFSVFIMASPSHGAPAGPSSSASRGSAPPRVSRPSPLPGDTGAGVEPSHERRRTKKNDEDDSSPENDPSPSAPVSNVDHSSVEEQEERVRKERVACLLQRPSLSAELDQSWQRFQNQHEQFVGGLIATIGMSIYDPGDIFKQAQAEKKEEQRQAQQAAEAEKEGLGQPETGDGSEGQGADPDSIERTVPQAGAAAGLAVHERPVGGEGERVVARTRTAKEQSAARQVEHTTAGLSADDASSSHR